MKKTATRGTHAPARSSTRFRERGDEKSPRHFRPGFLRSSGEYRICERFRYAESRTFSRACAQNALSL
jgi:hypothetical protein